MLRALTRYWPRRVDPSQLALELEAPPRGGDELLERLRQLGMTRIRRCRLTRNRNVMVSFRGEELRVHEGYLTAPVTVHRAIVTFVEGKSRRDRHAAQRIIVGYTIAVTPTGPPRKERMRPEDEPAAQLLAEHHAALNTERFGGTLKPVAVRVSRRMRNRLGHYTAATPSTDAEIAISWRHLRRHGWEEALETLLHEMVHQWQDETGHPIDHGPIFRRKAREVGVAPRAKRMPVRSGARA